MSIFVKSMKNKAFSLAELSISITIIAAIIGIVSIGKSLITQSKLRTIASEFNSISTAYINFYTQYNALPGDITTAMTLWPSPVVTANGNGNNYIDSAYNSNSPLEDTYVMQHLYLAGFISGPYVGGVQGSRFTIGLNAISSRIPGNGHNIANTNYGVATYSASSIAIEYSGLNNTYAGHLNGSALTPSDSYSLDLKIDDGLAYSGSLITARATLLGYNYVCINNVNSVPSSYLLNDSTVSCRILYILNSF